MRTLFLHCGYHKTGSSAIQLSLKRANHALEAKDWEFVYSHRTGNSSNLLSVWRKNGIALRLRKSELDELLANSTKTNVILSAEHFSLINDIGDVSLIRDVALQYFQRVVVVFYLRRQDKLAVSFKAQASKMAQKSTMPSSMLMGHTISALPLLSQEVYSYLNYNEKLRMWGEVFGNDNIMVRNYERGSLVEKDICVDFSSLLEIPVKLEKVSSNSSFYRRKSIVGNILLNTVSNKELISSVHSYLKDDDQPILPGRNEAIEFYNKFENGNRKLQEYLNESKALFDENFDSYPEKTNYHITNEDMIAAVKAINEATSSVKKKIYAIGDSHARIFDDNQWRSKTKKMEWEVCSVSGATLSGLDNPNSKTQALKIFDEFLETRIYPDATIFLLGEVDMGFVIWFRAQERNVSVEKCLSKAVENYTVLIKKALESSPVFVISTPLPTIPDYSAVGDVAKARAGIKASLKDRTELTLTFNRYMKNTCESIGANYIDLDSESLDEACCLKKSLKREDLSDHHYAKLPYQQLLSEKLLPQLRNLLFNV